MRHELASGTAGLTARLELDQSKDHGSGGLTYRCICVDKGPKAWRHVANSGDSQLSGGHQRVSGHQGRPGWSGPLGAPVKGLAHGQRDGPALDT